jgi:EAL domain-containing protein (putative c-di-GMP-specific phosphodiesterase class I)
VETAEENALLQSINQSSTAQGYFYSPALDGAAASALLTSAAPLS